MILSGVGGDSANMREDEHQPHVIVASLNTSWETRIIAPRWRRGSVTRVVEASTFPGGKPLNVLRLCISMGVRVRLVALADAGLAESVTSLCNGAGVPADLIVTAAPSRTTAAIVDERGRATVFNGEGLSASEDELARCLRILGERTRAGDVLVVSGSFPVPFAEGLVSGLSMLADARKARFLLDTSGPQLQAGLRASPDILKINERELAAVRGRAGHPSPWSQLRRVAPEPRNLVVTAGSRGLRGWDETGRHWLVRPPGIDAVNVVGAGDAVAAGMAAALASGGQFLDALVEGTAWAAARAERLDLAISRARVAEFVSRTRVRLV
jgi:fructose-1-phosphate kinase PfkB-like protein